MPDKILKIFVIFSLLLVSTGYSQTIPLNPGYLGLIQQRVNTYFIYPQEAQANGWEGIVKVRFTVAQDGRIKEIDIAESSGYPLLDAAAIFAIKDASPYPFPKDYIGRDELEVILPIHYVATQPEPRPPPEILPPLPASEEAKATPPEELTSFISLALENNQPTKLALQEIELAQLKMVEAKRSFFPSLKLQGYSTTGEVYKVDYEERESKVQVDQPLFAGGRLIGTLKQAQTNLEITQKNYDRLKLDVIQKTETAYYNLIAAKMHLEQQEGLLKEAEEIFEKIKKLSDMGMVIPLELTSAGAWLEQIRFQMDSIKQDLFMAELTFQQVLNIKEMPQIKMQLLEAKKLNLDLDTCIEVAMKNRPEIYLSELLVKFNDYGQRVETSKNKAFTIDFTGSYGRYEGHYKTEPWKESENWYVGFKASKPWGASTFNSSYSQEATQPRFGQTSATASSTMSAEFNLLDNFKRLSDKKRADIDLNRSLSDFDETMKTIIFETRDAFLNYQKAVLQLNTAQTEMKFRRNELEVTKIRALVGETSLSTAMGTLVNLSDTLTKYIQALANYQISLANLKKATGYGLRI
jgi:TonB family protein